jgi:MoaA/NifB/PqqE/SkfB family radical SAM enzyme
MFFSRYSVKNLAKGIIVKRKSPLYVQYYVTSRCNLTCKQCNIIYANAGVREISISKIEAMAENLKILGVAIVLLTGGEPFVRQDLPEIIRAFESRHIHVRTQTNGLATREQLEKVACSGARDISISLDSLNPSKQDFLNGSHNRSWLRMMETISLVTQTYPIKNSFASFGTVLSPHNLFEIPNIIRFATQIGWYVSLVPAHITTPEKIYNFRSYDREMVFPKDFYPQVDKILDECITLKKQGFALYDSYEYLKNIRRFIRGEKIDWREKNNNLCDSPDLYFAIRPNGNLNPCCDHDLLESYPVWHPDFPKWYKNGEIHKACLPHVTACEGCMYGSFPEISITTHYPEELIKRMPVFLKTPLKKPWPLTTEALLKISDSINTIYPVDLQNSVTLLENVQKQADVTFKRDI